MNSLQVSQWLPSFLIPFFTLSHPTSPPPDPDSFHDSLYYTTGILDACVIVSCIAVMAVLRDITRVYLMEPFAKWKLTRDWERSQRKKIKANGAPNGSVNGSSIPNGVAGHRKGEHAPLTMSKRDARKIHRSMLRFAEQGWSFIYYTVNFAFGVVSNLHQRDASKCPPLTLFRPSMCTASFPPECGILRICGWNTLTFPWLAPSSFIILPRLPSTFIKC